MNSAGLPIAPEWVRFGDFHVAGGREHAESLLALDQPPTAIFAGSDLQALGMLEAARRRYTRIPDDLSIVGYDDIPLAPLGEPGPDHRAPATPPDGRRGRTTRDPPSAAARSCRRYRGWI